MKKIFLTISIMSLFVISLSSTVKAEEAKVINIKNQKELEDLLKKDFVILKFTAKWCSACKLSEEPFEKLAAKNEFSHIHFAKIDTDNNTEIAKKYEIKSIPIFKLIKKGEDIHTEEGIPSLSLFEQYFSNIIKEKMLKKDVSKENEKGKEKKKTCMFEGARKFFQKYFDNFKSYFTK